jgi:hypothetical protein
MFIASLSAEACRICCSNGKVSIYPLKLGFTEEEQLGF